MPAAARSRLCSRVSAWVGAFARSDIYIYIYIYICVCVCVCV